MTLFRKKPAPEIAALRGQGFDAAGRRAGDPDCGRVWLSDAEGAVLACEQRMREQQETNRRALREIGTACDCRSCLTAQRALQGVSVETQWVPVATIEKTRQRTVAEIVEALRHDIEFHREGAEQRSLPAVADWIEDRFGGEKGEGDA